MIRFGREICGDLDSALGREWLETDGLGGFAASTIVGLNTRRYHGLLTCATQPPAGRMLLLAKLEETLVLGGRRIELGANRYPGAVHPQGHRWLVEFRLDPFPVFTYWVEGIRLVKTVFMVHGRCATVVLYQIERAGGAPAPGAAPALEGARLELRPLIAFRDHHSTTHRNDGLDGTVRTEPGLATVTPYRGLPSLHLAHDADAVEPGAGWHLNFEYDQERARGLDYTEDLYNPLTLAADLGRRASLAVIASTERSDVRQAEGLRREEVQRRGRVVAASPAADDFTRALTAAADQYLVKRGDGDTVIAGYPWFTDWGRDTMIALPGLTLFTGRADVARGILSAFAGAVDEGMLPNRFPDAGETPEYNTVDASLWFFEAVSAYLQRTGDLPFVRDRLYGVLRDILEWHVRGTRYGIRVDEDGLLTSGAQGVQLTWMDAKVGDWVVTPRRGKPVEIQALWYNAVRVMESLAHDLGDAAGEARWGDMAARARQSFNRLFWNEEAGCLFDVVDGESRDPSIRPNQVLVVGLPHGMLSREKGARVLAVVERELLTPYGLRSLAPGDPAYRPRYEGDPRSRDGAYHQGTVWPWLLGPFLRGYVKVNGGSAKARARAARWLDAFPAHLQDAGLGQISEVFDADPPHRPGGCFAQAWSVAEILRAIAEDLVPATGTSGASREMSGGSRGTSGGSRGTSSGSRKKTSVATKETARRRASGVAVGAGSMDGTRRRAIPRRRMIARGARAVRRRRARQRERRSRSGEAARSRRLRGAPPAPQRLRGPGTLGRGAGARAAPLEEACALCAGEYAFQDRLLREVRSKLRRVAAPRRLVQRVARALKRASELSGAPQRVDQDVGVKI